MLKVLTFADAVGPEDLALLQESSKYTDDDLDQAYLVEGILAQKLHLWRAPEALILTQIISVKGKWELLVVAMIGCGIFKAAQDIADDLRTIAKQAKCSSIGGNVFRPGLKRLYEKLGATPVSEYYRMEVE